jgi:hypothetical protein
MGVVLVLFGNAIVLTKTRWLKLPERVKRESPLS